MHVCFCSGAFRRMKMTVTVAMTGTVGTTGTAEG